MAEIYYHMKQTHMSMHHIAKAIECYREKDTYTIREIQCSFIIGLNYIDMGCPEKAMPHFEKALEKSVDSTTKRLRGSALYNLGLSHFHSEDLDRAIEYFKESVTVFKEQKYEHLNRILDPLIMLARSYFHNSDKDIGIYVLQEGIDLCEKLKDEVMYRVFTFYKALYVLDNYDKVLSDINYLSKKGMYPILEEITKDAARKYNSVGDKDRASNFYEKVLYFQKLIKRSDCLYEI